MSHPPLTPTPIDAALLDRYLSGQCEAVERAAVEQWLGRKPFHPVVVEALRHYRMYRDVHPTQTVDEGWAALSARIQSMGRSGQPPARSAGLFYSSRLSRWGVPVAVAMSIVLGLGYVILERMPATSGIVPSATREYTTTRGRQATVVLTDGSTVILAPETTLQYSAGGDVRTVSLIGEAFFTVAHRDARPFVVHARNAETRVLGTSFVVRNYPEDATVQVAVHDGRVATNAISLGANEVGWVQPDGSLRVMKGDTDSTMVFGWTGGTLVFHDTPLRQVVAQLSRWYDVDFVLSDPALGSLPLSAMFHGDPLDEVVTVLSHTLTLQIERHGRTFVVSHAKQLPTAEGISGPTEVASQPFSWTGE